MGLEPIVVRFQAGASPEKIVHSFPTVTLAQAYGAIAYYLENKQIIDEYMAEIQRQLEQIPPLSQTNPELFARLEAPAGNWVRSARDRPLPGGREPRRRYR